MKGNVKPSRYGGHVRSKEMTSDCKGERRESYYLEEERGPKTEVFLSMCIFKELKPKVDNRVETEPL